MISNRFVYALLSITLFYSSQQVFAGALDELDPADRDRVIVALAIDQKPISIRVKVNNPLAVWPEFRIFEKVNATPEQAAAVFADFKNHKTYFADLNITQSDIISGAGTSTPEVAYHINVPLFSDDYACLNKLSFDADQGTYSIAAEVIRSLRVYSKGELPDLFSHGRARFEPYEDGTLIIYSSMIVPKSSLAGWVVNWGESTALKTAEKFAKQIQSELAEEGTPTLNSQIASLKTALAH